MPTMIETELRKPEWQAGTPITLADGQEVENVARQDQAPRKNMPEGAVMNQK